ncbi:SpoIIE family protein phosphatase [Streptomyces sp. H39-S7]|uniref:SpoIIE family protein phosphatase n=1 Tax=Streptomyces sp. H39-S7 TaxID=3004357 RepID=UPI0022AF7DC2|nr:SpoIIE family protein phosphatase [Streptomyces sp. H39-S7]MCZ4119981.1 SpoIIE family protein phosphatase [Streptomyces sp. H39-S7]
MTTAIEFSGNNQDESSEDEGALASGTAWLTVSVLPTGGEPGGGRIVDASRRACRLLERDADAITQHPFTALVTDGSRHIARSLLMAGGRSGAGDETVTRQPVEFELSEGSVICMVSATRVGTAYLEGRGEDDEADILLIRLEEGRRWDNWETLRIGAVLSGESLWMYDEDEDRLSWLDGEQVHNRIGPGQSLDLDGFLATLHTEDRDRVAEVFHELRRGERDRVDIDYRVSEGPEHLRWLRTRSRMIRFGFGGPRRIVGTTADTTASVERHRALREAYASELRRGDLVAELSASFIAASTEAELTDAILHRLAPAFGGTGTLLVFVDDDRLRVTFGDGIDPALAHSLNGLPLDAPKPLAEAIRTGRPQFIASRDDYRATWPMAHSLLHATGAESFVMVPFLAGAGRPLGGWVIAYNRPRHLTPQEWTLLGALANLAGQAWERIRLHSVRVELANAVQRSMLPQRLPALQRLEIAARYVPARTGLDVGGDWYDVIDLPGGAAACIIGDVQGHNVTAAALMGQVRTAMRAYVWQDPEPDHVLACTNELMLRMGVKAFATCLYVLVTADGLLRTARAGHVPMVQAGPDGTAVVNEGPGGLPLGVLPEATYPIVEYTLPEGGMFALVTDGVVEGPRLSVDEGLARLGDTLRDRAGSPLDELADRAMGPARATGHDDDSALLLVRRNGVTR